MAEVRIADDILVDAPVEDAWRAIADPQTHARWHPFVTEIAGSHMLDQVRTCSVLIGSKPGQTRERCMERVEARRIVWSIEEDSTGFGRMVTDWRAGFSLSADDRGTAVIAQSTFRPRNVFVRAMLPIIRRRFHQTQRAILEGLKCSLEREGASRDHVT